MISSLLVANRGEIACRIFRTAKRMGIRTIAVYSEADAKALHVAQADEAYLIGPAPARDSYLDIEAIIRACKESGAEAVHPGYGFLSEQVAFVERLTKEKIIFVGPNPQAMLGLGDKIASKKIASRAGVSILPGSDGALSSLDEALGVAETIGFPVILKASAGGGGKGMRIARNRDELKEGFSLAASEARSSFNDDRVFIEKFIDDPRHIEIQILGDKHGTILHLGERECSLQRRNQKIIEEAPSPLLDEKQRTAMAAEAVKLAKAVNYDSAGTVEFVVDQQANFYFLEMNTRLQVEHPVTENIMGVDLVEQMLRVACGEKLRLKQEDMAPRGWSIECRLNAEDPTRNFLPSTGRISRLAFPETAGSDPQALRVETGIYEGSEISVYYDPMIAKLITYASTRKEATRLMLDVLDHCLVDGVRSNLAFLSSLLSHPRWFSGELATSLVAQDYPDGFTPEPPDGEERFFVLALASCLDHKENSRRQTLRETSAPCPFSPERVGVIKGIAAHAVEVLSCEVTEQGHNYCMRVSNQALDQSTATKANPDSWRTIKISSSTLHRSRLWTGEIDGKVRAFRVLQKTGGFILAARDHQSDVSIFTRREAELAALMPERDRSADQKSLLCPMPGLIKALLVSEGQKVEAGDVLCVVEAMKMENLLRAETGGTIKKLHTKEGDSLAVDAVILEFS